VSAPDRPYTDYPPTIYHDDIGEASAVVRRADAEPELTYTRGGTVSYLATNVTTDQQFGLYRWDFGTRVSGPDPHFHRTISESFFILEGTVRLFDGERWIDARKGDFLHVPQGGLHAFRNDSDAQAEMLLLFTPGAPREGYFEGLPGLAGATDEERSRFFDEHDSYFVD
jgi:quercetin dioxygenase-like cupin family protein